MPQNTPVPDDFKHLLATPPTARRRRRRVLLLALPLSAALAYALTEYSPSNATAPAASAASLTTSATSALAIPPPVAQPLGETIELIVQRHDTLERIFRRFRLSLDDLSAMLELPHARRALNRLRPGDKVTVVRDDDGLIHELSRRLSETEVLSVTRAEAGFAADLVETPVEIRRAYARGEIDSSLFAAAAGAGIGPEITLRLANDIFGWDIDFALDIREGDRFSLIYEQKYRDGLHLGDGRILAAEFVNDGDVHRAVYYASADGKVADYFTPEGRSMRRQFLRAPLDFRRISSNFSRARRHPILNTIRAHKGVDYAARTGTIIKAAGDGRVRFIGRKGGYGKVVILEHGGGISTLYGHMSRFAKGTHRGSRVRQGQTIGYVGSSGAATGPHLHYEYRVNGVHKNPRTVHLPDAAPLPAKYLDEFRSMSAPLLTGLEQMRGTHIASAE